MPLSITENVLFLYNHENVNLNLDMVLYLSLMHVINIPVQN